jgi:arabinofuranosyltransferase
VEHHPATSLTASTASATVAGDAVRRTRVTTLGLILIGALYTIYAAIFIWNTSFVVDGQRYFVLFDDAMVSMRYARNFAAGQGLIWNPGGAYVEGFTNPLWVAYMALVHMVVPLPPEQISVAIQITGAALLLANLWFVRQIAEEIASDSPFVALSAVLLTAFYLPLNNWGLQGMEVSAAVLATSAALWFALRSVRQGRYSVMLPLVLAGSTAIRPDMLVPALVIFGMVLAAQPRLRRRHLLISLPLIFGAIALQTLLRLRYYGDVLPNTYYLKMTGYPILLRITRGMFVTLDFVLRANWLLVLAPFLLLLVRRDWPVLLLLAVFATQLAYSVYVGGDAWEWWGGSNRYLCVAMPGFFVLLAYAIDRLRQWLLVQPILPQRLVNAAAVVGVALTLVNVNAIRGAEALGEWALLARPMHVAENQERVEIARLVQRITTPDATMAVVWAGATPYFAERTAIDLLGKNDTTIAHANARTRRDVERFTYFYPGHVKWNYDYSIGELLPDVVVEVWGSFEEARPYLDANYMRVRLDGHTLYLRTGSPHVRWELVGMS